MWEKEQIFLEGDKYFTDLIEGIRAARFSILFETYIFDYGRLGDRLVEAFKDAASRGVTVKILVDGYGSPGFSTIYEDVLTAPNISVRFYRTLPWDKKVRANESSNFLKRFKQRIYRLNHGTHRKYCLIDERRLWAGSYNVSDFHLQSITGEESWRDMGIYVEGPDVIWVKRAFSQSFEKGKELQKKKGEKSTWVLLNQTRHLKRVYRSAQIDKLKDAKERVWIETPYFAPLSGVFRRLVQLAKDGVDVRIIVPKRNDVWLSKWISYSYLFELARRQVQVYEYAPQFLHNKLFIIDQWMCLGSTNLNHRSFLHDLEMDIVVSHPENKDFLVNTVLEDLRNSVPLNQDIWAAFPWWKRLLSRFLSIFAYWA